MRPLHVFITRLPGVTLLILIRHSSADAPCDPLAPLVQPPEILRYQWPLPPLPGSPESSPLPVPVRSPTRSRSPSLTATASPDVSAVTAIQFELQLAGVSASFLACNSSALAALHAIVAAVRQSLHAHLLMNASRTFAVITPSGAIAYRAIASVETILVMLSSWGTGSTGSTAASAASSTLMLNSSHPVNTLASAGLRQLQKTAVAPALAPVLPPDLNTSPLPNAAPGPATSCGLPAARLLQSGSGGGGSTSGARLTFKTMAKVSSGSTGAGGKLVASSLASAVESEMRAPATVAMLSFATEIVAGALGLPPAAVQTTVVAGSAKETAVVSTPAGSSSSSSSSSAGGAIAGAVVGILVAAAALFALVRWRKDRVYRERIRRATRPMMTTTALAADTYGASSVTVKSPLTVSQQGGAGFASSPGAAQPAGGFVHCGGAQGYAVGHASNTAPSGSGSASTTSQLQASSMRMSMVNPLMPLHHVQVAHNVNSAVAASAPASASAAAPAPSVGLMAPPEAATMTPGVSPTDNSPRPLYSHGTDVTSAVAFAPRAIRHSAVGAPTASMTAAAARPGQSNIIGAAYAPPDALRLPQVDGGDNALLRAYRPTAQL